MTYQACSEFRRDLPLPISQPCALLRYAPSLQPLFPKARPRVKILASINLLTLLASYNFYLSPIHLF